MVLIQKLNCYIMILICDSNAIKQNNKMMLVPSDDSNKIEMNKIMIIKVQMIFYTFRRPKSLCTGLECSMKQLYLIQHFLILKIKFSLI